MRYLIVLTACLGQCKCQYNDANVYNSLTSIPKDSASIVKELFHQDSLVITQIGKGVFRLVPENRYMEYKIFRRDSLPVKNDTTDLIANENGLYGINVPLGSRYWFTLIDGTECWLNAGTNFRFKENESTYAELLGEGYLKCKRKLVVNAVEHRFTIPSGAKINISCYSYEAHKAAMVAGTALIDTIHIPSASLVEFSSTPVVKRNYFIDDPEDAICWTAGFLSFQDKTCDAAYHELMRWYTNVKISTGSNCLKGGRLSCSTKLQDIIRLLEYNKFKISYRVDSNCSLIIK